MARSAARTSVSVSCSLLARDRDADAGADVELGVRDRSAGSRATSRIRSATRVAAAGSCELVEQHGELVAAEPRDRVGGPQDAADAAADLDEHLVPVAVAEAVVDPLEAVDVDEQDADRRAVARAAAARQRVRDAVEQQRAVGQAGERVVEGAVAELVAALAQPRGHRVEGVGDLVELAERVELDAVGEIAAAEPPRRVAQRGERPPDRV